MDNKLNAFNVLEYITSNSVEKIRNAQTLFGKPFDKMNVEYMDGFLYIEINNQRFKLSIEEV